MDKQKMVSWLLLIFSALAILYSLVFPLDNWIVYLIAILCIPLFILGFGLITMAKPRKEDKEERIKEPFTGY